MYTKKTINNILYYIKSYNALYRDHVGLNTSIIELHHAFGLIVALLLSFLEYAFIESSNFGFLMVM